MAKKSNQETNGISFHGVEFVATPDQLITLFGDWDYGNNTGDDKVNMEWICETQSGEVFTIYDWKEYKSLHMDIPITWHIGAYNMSVSNMALNEIRQMLSTLK